MTSINEGGGEVIDTREVIEAARDALEHARLIGPHDWDMEDFARMKDSRDALQGLLDGDGTVDPLEVLA